MSMRVLLIDIDSRIPNLALMRLSAWHKEQGDTVELGHMSQPDRVYVSCVFTWSRVVAERAIRLPSYKHAYRDVGGPGVDLERKLPKDVESMRPDYSLYAWAKLDRRGFTKPFGQGYLIKGCPRRCEFCIVPKMDPVARQVATIDDLLNPASNFIVLMDDNFLAKPKVAMGLLDEMVERDIEVCFSQGLDIRFVTEAIAAKLATVKYWNLHHTGRQVTFAFDSLKIEAQWRRGVERLIAAGITGRHIQSFFLVGFDSTFEEDMERFRIIRSYGADPYCMVFRDRDSGKVIGDRRLFHFARWVNRRVYKSEPDFEQYSRWAKQRSQGVLL